MNQNVLKSIGAIAAGFIVVIIISIVTDAILEKTGLMKKPFDLNPDWFIIFVIFYRSVYGVIGSYITARLAPVKPMLHSMIGGAIGFVISIAGTIIMWDKPPHWYAISLIVTALPCAWLGGYLFVGKARVK